eukprot:gene29440-45513_t
MPFDSELGRMSEHMLVLLCRVQNFKIKANQVLEFAEGNVQFAALLLAILLCKGHPTAFFTMESVESIQEKSLSDFEDKINQICKLSKRLLVVQVVAEATNTQLLQDGHVRTKPPAGQATAFRQHVITSTTFVDQVVVPYVCKLIGQIAQTYEMHQQKVNVSSAFNPLQPPPRPMSQEHPKEVISGLVCSLRFLALCTFHMGSYGRTLRFINSFTHDLLRLPLDSFVSKQPAIFGALLQYNCNIDALAGEDKLPQGHLEHLPVECQSEYIVSSISTVLSAMSPQDTTKLQ